MKLPNWGHLIWPLIVLFSSSVESAEEAQVAEAEGKVLVKKLGATAIPARIGTGLSARDKLATGESSRAVLRMTSKWFARIDEDTDIEITPSALTAKDVASMKVSLGGAFIFSREEEGELKLQTPSATGGLRGTQLFVRVQPGGKTLMQVIEGEVDLANAAGHLLLKAGEAGEAEHGRAPRRTAALETRNVLQWVLYYPAVIQRSELGLTDGEQRAVAASLEAYSEGDLLGALAKYPHSYTPSSAGGKLYRAAVLLATGRVADARKALAGVPANHAGRQAIERMLAAVLFEEQAELPNATTAGLAMAESYYQQSRARLEPALAAARRATMLAPESGFAWTRLAELEFSFGRTSAAKRALERGLLLTPRNAQAHALRGFLLAAENRIPAARESFERAVQMDGGLGNGWLGLGLTKIRQGHSEEGRADIQTAVTVEPTRAFLYSYHGKALDLLGLNALARKDFALAKLLDPNDPTPWLYSAIQKQQENHYNTAIDDLQESIRLNDNRRVYRSQFLLDQDRAVRSANLAKVYQNAGMNDLAVREATRAVESDYASSAAHLFLANSFDALRDPSRIQLRYETPWFNELLLANLLSPVGGGSLSQFVSQQEYSKLFEADGAHFSSDSEWRGDGIFRENASLFGTFGDFSFALDGSYYSQDGTRLNNRLSLSEVCATFKYQVSPDDTAFFLTKWGDQKQGDLFQTYDNAPLVPFSTVREKQEPGLLLAGWNHRWAPGSHTLLLAGLLAAEQRSTSPATTQTLVQRDSLALIPGFITRDPVLGDGFLDPRLDGSVSLGLDSETLQYSPAFRDGIAPFVGKGVPLSLDYSLFDFYTRLRFELYTAELQHIWQTKTNTAILGGRWVGGDFETDTLLTIARPSFAGGFPTPAAAQHSETSMDRLSLYAYDTLQLTSWLTLIGGVSWDRIEHPDNFRSPPVNDRQRQDERVSGKAGFTLSPSRYFTVRGVYAEGLGGVTFDESVRLEPVQLAGFNQAFRTVISESLQGSVETPHYKNYGLSIEGSLPTRTWWSAAINGIEEDVERTVGVFDGYESTLFKNNPAFFPASQRQTLAYREETFSASIHQLLGDEFSLSAIYRFTHAELRSTYPELTLLDPTTDKQGEGVLHHLIVAANWNSPTGLFARAEGHWYSQELDGADFQRGVVGRAGDDFWQFNAILGYRFAHNRCELSVGVLNLTDTDYRLDPITYHETLPRERTAFIRCKFTF